MNTPSPAPNRRRRQPGADAPLGEMPLSSGRQGHPARPGARRPSRRASPLKAAVAYLESIPTPVRFVLITLCVILFFTCAVAVTRNYLQAQEERRRLEAEAAERAQHPLEYAGLIAEYSLMRDIDPALVSAVILCESSFNPQAESRLGARGLMQLMEDTAGWVAHKLDEDDSDYSFDSLYDPETNIRFGTWYLGYLSRRFGGDATKIVCAYHAGQGNVDAWLANPEYSSDGVTLDVIPTQDTATYASRVLRARDVYRKYYFPAPTAEPGTLPE